MGTIGGATSMDIPSDKGIDAALVWFRRDLRADDHTALAAALEQARRVWCVFVFDREILDPLADRDDRRVAFIHASVRELDERLRRAGGGLIVVHDTARTAVPALAAKLGVQAVFANRDYEPAAIARDAEVAGALAARGGQWREFKDQVVFDRDELLTGSGRPYAVFTPYKKAWLARLSEADLAERRVRHRGRLAPPPAGMPAPSLEQIGFVAPAAEQPRAGASGAAACLERLGERIGGYGRERDFPALDAGSRLSVHLRFGTISLRRLARFALEVARADPQAAEGARVFLSELIWREFYFQVLFHNPHVVHASFRPEYDRIRWESGAAAEALFAAWCEGRTGYPLVDAAMAQINRTGYMHNRLRMVTASFLVKDLGVDWRRGEAYFARRLIDFDLAANNGGWQWCASSGCDAQPWFRIFNPVTQSRRFDPEGRFIRRHLPQLARLPDGAIHAPWLADAAQLAAAGVVPGENYPLPLVDHAQARAATLERYAVVKE